MRAAQDHGLPLMLAIIGGDPRRFVPWANLYREALAKMGKGRAADRRAFAWLRRRHRRPGRRSLFADYKRMRDKIGSERGWPPMTPGDFEREIEHGSLYVGSPETVARKIVATAKALGVDRFDLKYSAGPLSHDQMMRSIELYGRRVIPMVREMMRPEKESGS